VRARRESELQSPHKSKTVLGGGIADSYVVTLENGKKGAWKPNRGEPSRSFLKFGLQDKRENAAWQVAKIVDLDDLVPASVMRKVEGDKGVLIEWRDGKKGADVSEKDRYDGKRDLERAAIFDLVMGQSDRHPGNWLVADKPDGTKQLVLIDHGFTLPDQTVAGFRPSYDNNHFLKKMAAGDRRPTPELVAPYIKNKKAILDELTEMGLPKRAVAGVQERIEALSSGKNWDDLYRNTYHATDVPGQHGTRPNRGPEYGWQSKPKGEVAFNDPHFQTKVNAMLAKAGVPEPKPIGAVRRALKPPGKSTQSAIAALRRALGAAKR